MGDLKIKNEAKDKQIGFGTFSGKVGTATPAQLQELATIAVGSNDPSLIDLFEGPLPSLEDLQKTNVDAKIKNIPKENTAANK